MSQDFQDLSGQVISKVMKMLERMEKPLHHVLGDQPKARRRHRHAEELAGVQTPDKGAAAGRRGRPLVVARLLTTS